MNTSRDIEKLFDHFGGNAGNYQEIGRENEATTARTRWPLLATLDFAQPAIPEIAPRRDAQLNASRARSSETPDEPADKPTPIHRGKQPLFTRPHRRTIPAVNPPAAASLSALRFSVLGEAASNETGTTADPAPAPAAPAESKPVANAVGTQAPATFGSNFLARRTPAQAVPIPPAVKTPRTPEPAPAAPQSILGKLFKQPVQNVPGAPAGSLDAMFERLRHARSQDDESTNTQAGAGHAAHASRHSRS
ncbi:hypothetical protein NOV72_00312 [Caballeronia novacaledonica]|uniref:Cellulose biosynthesis protein BcsR n=1 Tax=Caballeronia novacaledonica TaxID=1544861 RepID=A0A2U3HYX1_9BURK|nr:cellulose biosynthesis protein BcsP [Caballeronia novacaledonica]SPB13012.1 hypothetical protein NOV72_00312 [Caballeronia novacaledonica]